MKPPTRWTKTIKADLYSLVRASGIGFISAGHRETLLTFHKLVLRLERAGKWVLSRRERGV